MYIKENNLFEILKTKYYILGMEGCTLSTVQTG